MSIDDLIKEDPEFKELYREKLQAEVRKTKAEANRWEAEAEKSHKDLEAWNASADEHRIYNFFGQVDGGNVSAAMDVIGNWCRRSETSEVTIVFNSPGGNIINGLALYDFLDELKRKGNSVNTVCRGMAASMGGVLLQAGEKRTIGANGHILIHEASSLNIGKTSEMEDSLKFTKMLQTRCLEILASRSSMTTKQIENKWKKTDWWIGAQEAVDLGFADEIA